MEYVTSSFGVNIGTGLMLESIMPATNTRIDEDRKIPNKVDLKNYNTWWINLHSLIVNILTSYDKDTVDVILKSKDEKITKMVLEKISDELEILMNIIPNKIKFFYLGYPKYKKYLSEHDKETKVGKTYLTALKYVLLIKNEAFKDTGLLSHAVKYNIIVSETANTINLMGKKDLITTSNTIDLIHGMDLLEFHTGVLKGRNLFYTKLKTKEPIPFEELLLLALGDKKNMISSPLTFKEKKYLLDVILKKKYRSYSRYSKSKILSLIDDKVLLDKLKQLPNIY